MRAARPICIAGLLQKSRSIRRKSTRLISATSPCVTTCRRLSGIDGRDRGSPNRCGTGQRLNLNDETGEKRAGAPPRGNVEVCKDILVEAFSPLAQDLGAAYPGVRRSGRWTDLAPLTRRFW